MNNKNNNNGQGLFPLDEQVTIQQPETKQQPEIKRPEVAKPSEARPTPAAKGRDFGTSGQNGDRRSVSRSSQQNGSGRAPGNQHRSYQNREDTRKMQDTVHSDASGSASQAPDAGKQIDPTPMRSINVQELKDMNIVALIAYAQELGIPEVASLKKQEI